MAGKKKASKDLQLYIKAWDKHDIAGALQILKKNPKLVSHQFLDGGYVTHRVAAVSDVTDQQLQELFKHDVDAAWRDGTGHTSLHAAVLRGNERYTQFLLQEDRADITAVTAEGQTALHLAVGDVTAGRDDVTADCRARLVQMLLQAGAPLTAMNNVASKHYKGSDAEEDEEDDAESDLPHLFRVMQALDVEEDDYMELVYKLLQYSGQVGAAHLMDDPPDVEDDAAQGVHALLTAPRPLTHLCRRAARARLRPAQLCDVTGLRAALDCLPSAVLDYLLYDDVTEGDHVTSEPETSSGESDEDDD